MTDREAIDYLIAEIQIRGNYHDRDYTDAIMAAIRALNAPYAEHTHTNPEDTYREDFGSYVEESKRVEATCKPSNRPVDERNDGEPINVSTENKRPLMPMIEAYSVEWYEEGVTHCPQFTDIENAIKFADKVMHDKPKVDMVTIRRSEW